MTTTIDLAPTVSASKRTVEPRHCRNCGAIVLVGLDSDICGFPVAVDPVPITYAGELWCLVHPSGRRYTYQLWGGELGLRDDRQLRTPVTFRHFTVVAQHWCNQPVPPQFHAPAPDTYRIPDEPQF